MKTQSILKTVLLAAGFSAFTLIGAQAAPVTQLTGGDSTDGWVAPAPANSVLAYNLNDGGIQNSGDPADSLDQVIQGVTFTSWSNSSLTAPTVAAGVTTTRNSGGGASFYFNAPVSFGVSSDDASMAALVKTIFYNGTALNFSISGLAAGNYVLDEFVMSGGGGARTAQVYSIDGTPMETVSEAANTAYVIENDVTVNGSGTLTFGTSGPGTPILGGFDLSVVPPVEAPEPSTYALMGLGALALLVISRRRKA